MADKQETANPYNLKKSWHEGEDKPFVSSENMYFPEPTTENVEQEGNEEKQLQDDSSEQSQPYSQPNYKKRYDDLKKHYDSKLNEFKQKELELIEQAQQGQVKYTPPKSEEELAEFKKKYPDVYDVVETVATMQSESKAKHLEEKVKLLQEREQQVLRLDAEKELKRKHPDFDNIRNSDDFHNWAKSQPESIQNWIYKNSNDPEAASRAIDLFKRDIGLDASSVQEPQLRSENRANAADMVSTKTTSVDPKTAKVWTEKEISQLSMAEFDKFEEEISNAMQEGRIVR